MDILGQIRQTWGSWVDRAANPTREFLLNNDISGGDELNAIVHARVSAQLTAAAYIFDRVSFDLTDIADIVFSDEQQAVALAAALGWAKEAISGHAGQEFTDPDTFRDLWNNEIGRQIGVAAALSYILEPSGGIRIDQLILEAYYRGNLIVHLDDSRVFTSFGDAIFGPKCFPAGTDIQLTAGQCRPIETIRPGDVVTSFDGAAFNGRGNLVEKRVTRTFENITETWVKLSWQEHGEARELTVTPGHHFLDSRGGFRPIDAILTDDGVIVLEDGSGTKVTGEYIHYSADTADMFEQAEGYVTPTAGGFLAVGGEPEIA